MALKAVRGGGEKLRWEWQVRKKRVEAGGKKCSSVPEYVRSLTFFSDDIGSSCSFFWATLHFKHFYVGST